MVLSQNTKRDSGKKVQLENINAGKTIGDVIRTCLGPRAMLKMLMDPMGGIVMTNDGNAILREITVQHPAAKTMIEIARTQDEEVGDGTTSVIIMAAEVLGISHQFLEEKIHPTVIIQAYRQALEDSVNLLREKVATPIDLADKVAVRKVIQSCVGTKFISKWSDMACTIILRGASIDIVVPGGGAAEMEIAHQLGLKAKSLNGVIQWPYKALSGALEIIPRTLAQNCGANTIRTLTALRAKHAQEQEKNVNWGINGETGELADMSALGIWEPLSVKLQVYKTAIETAILLLRIDDIVSGSKKKDAGDQGPAVDHGAAPPGMEM